MSFDPILLGLGLAVGLAAGAIYFAALWRSVRRLPGAARPVRALLLGALVRLALLLPALYLALQAGPAALLGALAGFLLARTAALRWLGRPHPSTGSG